MRTLEKVRKLPIRRSWTHWLVATVLVVIGLFAGDYISKKMIFERALYPIFGKLQSVSPRPIRPRRTVLVLIGDQEFYGERLAHRTPTKRDYLADLIRKLSDAGPELIALDFTMRSASGQDSKENPEYEQETSKLKQAITEASLKTKLVLAITVAKEENSDSYSVEPTVLDDLYEKNLPLAKGFVHLPEDQRRVPLTLKSSSNMTIDSFAAAAVRLVDGTALAEAEANRVGALPFGTFIEPAKFKTLSASEVLTTDPVKLKSDIACKIVLIGGVWHATPQGRPFESDLFLTPVGKLDGVFVHANFIEALLDSRTYRPLGPWVAISLEALLSSIVAVILGLTWPLWRRLRLLVLVCAFLVLLSYVLWQNLGVFFDCFVPILLLVIHVLVERLLG